MFLAMKLSVITVMTAIVLTSSWYLSCVQATDYSQARLLAAKHNMTCLLVFGDSTVDPGNNNNLRTQIKSNFLPYGKDFLNGQPSGRFCDGRLATDFIAEAFGYSSLIKGFLDPNIAKNDLMHGVSFASAGSGYDELTANLSKVISMQKQMSYLRHYKIHLRSVVGAKEAEKIMQNAMFLMSMGTNDFLQNYYLVPDRSNRYDIEEYQNYLISIMKTTMKTMYSLGARKLAVVGVPPFGCLPLVRTFRSDINSCDGPLNKVAYAFNSKIQRELKVILKGSSSSFKAVYVDIYDIILDAVDNPKKYGFKESMKGCCGSGTFEYGITCKDSNTCLDRGEYVFWDAVHPTEHMYKIIADQAIEVFLRDMF